MLSGLFIGVSSAFVGGCATQCPSTTMTLVLQASDRLNPDDRGRALATVVRVYQLKSAVKMEGAGFEDVWLHANETLQGDLLKTDEFTLFPRGKMDFHLRLDKETAFVVAVALFRRPGGASWRSIYEVPQRKCGLFRSPPPVARRFLLQDYRIEARSER